MTATLLSRGIVCVAARGQYVDILSVPMMIPDDVWDVLIEHKQEFPYSFTPKNRDDLERHPWRHDAESYGG